MLLILNLTVVKTCSVCVFIHVHPWPRGSVHAVCFDFFGILIQGTLSSYLFISVLFDLIIMCNCQFFDKTFSLNIEFCPFSTN